MREVEGRRGVPPRWLALLVVLALVASACGDDDDGASTESDSSADNDSSAEADEPEDSTDSAEDEADEPESEAAELRVTWWGGDSRHEATLAMIEVCEAAHPNISVVAEFQGWEGYWDKIATLTAAGNAPDVYQHNFGFFGEYVERDALLALDARSELDLSGWDSAIDHQGTSGDSRFALPTGGNVNTLIYDVEAIAAAGVDEADLKGDLTWAEFAEIADTVSAAGGDGFYAVRDSGGSTDVFEVWVKQQGGQLYNADGTLGFEAADLAAYWDYWSGMRESGAVPPIDLTVESGQDLASHPLSTGTAAMQLGFSAQFNAYTEASGKQLGLAPQPNGGTDAEPGMFNIATGLMWAASSDTAYPAEAATLINCMVNNPDSIAAQGLQRGVPLSQAGRDLLDVGPTDAQIVEYISEQATSGNVAAQSVLYTAPPLGSSEVLALFEEKYFEVGFGASSADAATEFIQEASEILSNG